MSKTLRARHILVNDQNIEIVPGSFTYEERNFSFSLESSGENVDLRRSLHFNENKNQVIAGNLKFSNAVLLGNGEVHFDGLPLELEFGSDPIVICEEV